MANGVKLSMVQRSPLTLTQSLASRSRHPVTGALAGPVWLAVPASCRDVQGQTWRWKTGRESWSPGVQPSAHPGPATLLVLTHVPRVFSWLALESLQALGGLALGVPLAGEVFAQGLTALPLVGGWEALPAAQRWGSVGKRAESDAVRSCGRGVYDSEGQRHPGETQGAGPAGKGGTKCYGTDFENMLYSALDPTWSPHLTPAAMNIPSGTFCSLFT